MNYRSAAVACLIAAGGAVCVIALLRTLDALMADTRVADWFWNDTVYGQPVSWLWIVGGIMFGVGLSLARWR